MSKKIVLECTVCHGKRQIKGIGNTTMMCPSCKGHGFQYEGEEESEVLPYGKILCPTCSGKSTWDDFHPCHQCNSTGIVDESTIKKTSKTSPTAMKKNLKRGKHIKRK